MDIIVNNPYRILGVFANASKKDIVANEGKIKAFAKVGRASPFPLDSIGGMSYVERTLDAIERANALLSLPKDKLRYAQFWFIKDTPLDDIAFNHLFAGDMEMAMDIWQKSNQLSSLQNLIVCSLIREDYKYALNLAELLYNKYSSDFSNMILGDVTTISENVSFLFLDSLAEEVDFRKFHPYIHNDDWKEHLSNVVTAPLIKDLLDAVNEAKKTKGQGPVARYKAGKKLKSDTKDKIKRLKRILPPTNLQYQSIADKLGLEIMQCGIDYFNDSEEPDAALKIKPLQTYALSIVVGQMAKDRCKENGDILNDIIKNLPPAEVLMEDKIIKEELRKFALQPNRIMYSVSLLYNTRPYLQDIKSKLGSTNPYYLKISTQVVGNALNNVIEEVNSNVKSYSIVSILNEAWSAIKIMDGFDMEADFKANRYNQNRNTLQNLCRQVGVSTSVTEAVMNGFDKADDATGGCLGVIGGYLIIGLIIMIIASVVSLIGELF